MGQLNEFNTLLPNAYMHFGEKLITFYKKNFGGSDNFWERIEGFTFCI